MQPICQSTSTRDFTYAEWPFRGGAADQWTGKFLLNDYAESLRALLLGHEILSHILQQYFLF